jgi:hypothetical protein
VGVEGASLLGNGTVIWRVDPNILKNCSAFKTLVTTCPKTQHNMPQDLHRQQHHSEKLKSNNNKILIMSQLEAARWAWNITSRTVLFTEFRKHEPSDIQQNVHPKRF